MAAPSTRSPSRTPPFVLVGLLLVLSILALKYWSLSSETSRLQSEVDKLTTKSNEILTQKGDIQVVMDHLRQENTLIKKQVTDLKTQSISNEKAAEDAKLEVKKRENSLLECKTDKNKYEESLSTKTEDINKLNAMKADLSTQLEQAKANCAAKSPECNMDTCAPSVKEILTILASKMSTDEMKKALSDGGKDYYKLMEGIPENKPVQPGAQNEVNDKAPAEDTKNEAAKPAEGNPEQAKPEEPKASQAKEPIPTIVVQESNDKQGDLVFKPEVKDVIKETNIDDKKPEESLEGPKRPEDLLEEPKIEEVETGPKEEEEDGRPVETEEREAKEEDIKDDNLVKK